MTPTTVGGDPVGDEMPTEVPFTGDFLAAVIASDYAIIDQMRDHDDIDWWNVSLTLAYLIKGTFTGDALSMNIIADAFKQAEQFRTSPDD